MKLIPIGPNQTELHLGDAVIFFSYQTPVAASVCGKLVRTRVKHSVTTSKHVNKWLGGAAAEVVDQSYLDELACSCRR